MKKLSILLVLAMILTIGGVYATWNYAQGDIEGADVSPVVTMTDKVVDTPMGTIAVDMSGFNIAIDDTNGDYNAECVMSGAINVTFVADAAAPATVKANGIKLQYTVTVTNPWTYNGVQVFTATTDAMAMNNGAATFNATITAAELMNVITLGDISLPTVDAYDAFARALTQGTITITVSEAQ